jgi:hypothetical protein
MAKLAVVFQSGKGHTKTLADSSLKGVHSVEEASGNLFEIRGQDVHEGRLPMTL